MCTGCTQESKTTEGTESLETNERVYGDGNIDRTGTSRWKTSTGRLGGFRDRGDDVGWSLLYTKKSRTLDRRDH